MAIEIGEPDHREARPDIVGGLDRDRGGLRRRRGLGARRSAPAQSPASLLAGLALGKVADELVPHLSRVRLLLLGAISKTEAE